MCQNSKNIFNSIIVVFLVLLLSSCKTLNKVKFSGEISNLSARDSIIKLRAKDFEQGFKVDSTGRFSNRFEIKEEGVYSLHFNGNRIPVFLKKGYNLKLKTDSKDVSKLIFNGNGKATNNFLVASNHEYRALLKDYRKLNALDSISLKREINVIKNKMNRLYFKENVDRTLAREISDQFEKVFSKLRDKTPTPVKQQRKTSSGLKAGDIAPQFNNLENYNGGTTSMEDLKGKYIYIDVWATWCGPCRAQIPALKVLEEEYRDKNIEFVSISSDRPKSYDRWRRMIEREEMKGIQLYMGNDKSFMRDFGIRGIPRFIFIDPEGKIVRSSAPRPSQTAQVKQMFTAAGL